VPPEAHDLKAEPLKRPEQHAAPPAELQRAGNRGAGNIIPPSSSLGTGVEVQPRRPAVQKQAMRAAAANPEVTGQPAGNHDQASEARHQVIHPHPRRGQVLVQAVRLRQAAIAAADAAAVQAGQGVDDHNI